MLSSHGGFPTTAMHHHGEQSNQTNTISKKKAHDSQIARAKENLKFSRDGPVYMPIPWWCDMEFGFSWPSCFTENSQILCPDRNTEIISI